MASATFTVTVHWSHLGGKFAPRDEIVDKIVDALSDDSTIVLSDLGPDGDTEYSVDGVDVEEQRQQPKSRQPRAAEAGHTVEVVFIDGAYRVTYDGRLCSPTWEQRGPADAYRALLISEWRKPEFSEESGRGNV